MIKHYPRGSREYAKRVVPRFVDDYMGEGVKDLDTPLPQKCPYCGNIMYLYDTFGNIARYACDHDGCPNNPNTNWKHNMNTETIPLLGNNALRWDIPKPRF